METGLEFLLLRSTCHVMTSDIWDDIEPIGKA